MILSRGLRRSLSDFRLHPWLHLASICTIAISLLIIGSFLLLYRNFEFLAEKASPALTGTIYLKEALTEPEIKNLRERVLSLENVRQATFKPKHKVVEELQVFLGASGMENLPGSELFPDVLEVEIKKDAAPQTVTNLRNIIQKYTEVSEVDFSEDWLAQFKKVRNFLQVFAAVLIVCVLFGCGFMIANFMGMRHQARRNEIDIVNLMGAHRNFILTPFIWEGLIEGILGSGIAFVLIYILKGVLSTVVALNWSHMLGVNSLLYLGIGQFLLLLAIGIATALVGGITVFLRFQGNATT